MAAKRDAMLAAGPRAQRSTLLEHYMGARLADGDDLDTHFLSVRCGLFLCISARVECGLAGQHLGPAQSAPPLWAHEMCCGRDGNAVAKPLLLVHCRAQGELVPVALPAGACLACVFGQSLSLQVAICASSGVYGHSQTLECMGIRKPARTC